MALRLLHGLLRRPTSKLVRFAAVNGDSDLAAGFSMTQSGADAGGVLLSLSGDIDLICQDSLRNRLIAIIDIDRADRLFVDLDEVTFLDCSGIGALVAGYNAALAAGCRYELRNPHGIVSTMLRACGIDMMLGIDVAARPPAGSFAA
jgi:anti-sigma B factor antagonist